MTRLAECVAASAMAAARIQAADGSFQPGHNGPRSHPDTPVRNTANWMAVLAAAGVSNGSTRLVDAAHRALDFVLRPEWRMHGTVFRCRSHPGLPDTNGLVGQAWVVRALVRAAVCLNRPDALDAAGTALRAHRINRRGWWDNVNNDGQTGFNTTFNQQIHFAAACSAFVRRQPDAGLEHSLRRVCSRLANWGTQSRDGEFAHRIEKRAGRRLLIALGWLDIPPDPQNTGYHAFCLAGLAMLHADGRLPAAALRMARRGLRPLFVADWRRRIEADAYAGGYNPTGFEAALALTRLGRRLDEATCRCAQSWLDWQLDRHFDAASGWMTRNSPDPVTLAARMADALPLLDGSTGFDASRQPAG